MYFSTLSSWVLLIKKALDSYGCDSLILFEQAGLDPRYLDDPEARYPQSGVKTLWRLAVEASGDEAFGLRAARYWHPTTLHALGFSWMASASLHDGLERLVRYGQVVTDAGWAQLEEREEGFRFLLLIREPALTPPDAALDAVLATLVRMCRTSLGEEFSPRRVALCRPPPKDPGPFQDYFRAPLVFEVTPCALDFDREELLRPLPTANAQLARANDRIINDYLARFERTSVIRRVKARLIEQLPSGQASQESVARAVHLSPRSLQRKLREEGTTYTQLLEDTRRELAAQYVRDARLSINEITYLLGFSEPANFSRSFKRWTGVSPSAYRSGGQG
ncbi:MAG: AraC family transcriptional regulator [Candidatus Competibacteraceae bacterium]|nr:AraC family transcriptional regulator [Candidatus Competibacteraceae bacterium]